MTVRGPNGACPTVHPSRPGQPERSSDLECCRGLTCRLLLSWRLLLCERVELLLRGLLLCCAQGHHSAATGCAPHGATPSDRFLLFLFGLRVHSLRVLALRRGDEDRPAVPRSDPGQSIAGATRRARFSRRDGSSFRGWRWRRFASSRRPLGDLGRGLSSALVLHLGRALFGGRDLGLILYGLCCFCRRWIFRNRILQGLGLRFGSFGWGWLSRLQRSGFVEVG